MITQHFYELEKLRSACAALPSDFQATNKLIDTLRDAHREALDLLGWDFFMHLVDCYSKVPSLMDVPVVAEMRLEVVLFLASFRFADIEIQSDGVFHGWIVINKKSLKSFAPPTFGNCEVCGKFARLHGSQRTGLMHCRDCP